MVVPKITRFHPEIDTRKITLISGAQEKNLKSPVEIFETSGCKGEIKDGTVNFEGIINGQNNCDIGINQKITL